MNNPEHIGNISYIYDASGVKLKKITTEGSSVTTTEYAGNYIYEAGFLQFFNTAEGYVEPKGTGWEYVFQYKDHLGNIRLSYADADGNGIIAQTEIREENNYYPFGLKHKGYNATLTGKDHKYGFGNKEEQDELNLAWLDFGARNYDVTLGRWMNIDRYAESFMPISTYQYAANNPVLYLDYNGDYITIGIKDDYGNAYSVLYENGKAYHYSKDSDGNITKGDEYDGKDNGFLNRAIADLDKVGGTGQGGHIVRKLQESSEGYNISNSGDALSNTFNYKTNELSYSQNAVGRYDGVTFEKSHIKLGHELSHAYDKDRGFDFSLTSLGGLPSSEINAVRFENYLRAQDGESIMRLNYTYGGQNYNLRSALGGKSSGYFNSYIVPLGRNEIYKRISPPSQFNPRIDNTYVRQPVVYGVYDTKKKSFVSFD
ncbi:MAG: hypothetical protein CVT96_07425 [Bacteroidetes bacterium HGW-Bacteroidetes-13]|nr:MAG: hypothetical protein CVT96_07425 [Bacteroidetes bacterium HGW-Bacteroidetes-13]